MFLSLSLHNIIAAKAPIHGISIGIREDKSTWKIIFKQESTPEQRIAAEAILSTFNLGTDIVIPKTKETLLEERIAILEERLKGI